MRRRELIVLLGGAAVGLPHAVLAQQAGQSTVGFFGSGTPSSQKDQTAAFAQRLRELGWVEGRNLTIAYRWAEGRTERYDEIAAELVRLKADVIVASGGVSVQAVKRATSSIAVVFPVVNDPLGTGLVATLARPGGNITGLSLQNSDLAGKRVELLREVRPDLRRVAVMASADPGAMGELRDVRAMLGKLGVQDVPVEIKAAADIAASIQALRGAADALYVCSDAITIANRIPIAALALAERLPTMNGPREFADAGGLVAYGANIPDLFRRSAEFVDKILRGAKPADLPVEQPIKFDLVINLKTAKALDLTIPPIVLARADEVIE